MPGLLRSEPQATCSCYTPPLPLTQSFTHPLLPLCSSPASPPLPPSCRSLMSASPKRCWTLEWFRPATPWSAHCSCTTTARQVSRARERASQLHGAQHPCAAHAHTHACVCEHCAPAALALCMHMCTWLCAHVLSLHAHSASVQLVRWPQDVACEHAGPCTYAQPACSHAPPVPMCSSAPPVHSCSRTLMRHPCGSVPLLPADAMVCMEGAAVQKQACFAWCGPCR